MKSTQHFTESMVFRFACSAAAVLVASLSVYAGVADDILSLTGNKRAWVVYATGNAVKGIDTKTGKEVTIVSASQPGRPLVSRDGSKVIYYTGGTKGVGDFSKKKQIWVVGWDGKGNKKLSSNGYLCSIWYDGKTEYAIGMKSDTKTYFKVPIDGGSEEVILKIKGGGRAELQLSADGKRGCHAIGRGKSGRVDFSKNPPKVTTDVSKGACRPSMAPDNSYRWTRFHSPHVKVEMWVDGKRQGNVNLPDNGGEAYYPRFGSDPRFYTYTRRIGGPAILGRFNSSFTKIEKHFYITKSKVYHPYVRILAEDVKPTPVVFHAQITRPGARPSSFRMVRGRTPASTFSGPAFGLFDAGGRAVPATYPATARSVTIIDTRPER